MNALVHRATIPRQVKAAVTTSVAFARNAARDSSGGDRRFLGNITRWLSFTVTADGKIAQIYWW
jgi:hypothetical protein